MLTDVGDVEVLLVLEPDGCELFFGEDALRFVPELVGLFGDEDAALRSV